MISIVMPVKNAAPFLSECLDSIIDQSFSDWELLAINDHSTDLSLQILKQYSNADNRITVMQNKGEGIINALKLAFSLSKGLYISRMDADDIMPKHKLKWLKEKLEAHGENYVSLGMVKYFSNEPLGKGYKKYADWLNDLTINQNNFSEIYKECVIPSPNWLMHKSDFVKIGAFDSEVYPEDYELCFRMKKFDLKICSVNEITHLWRDHQSRASRNDDNYKDNNFLHLKLSYFIKLDYNRDKKLVLWGAGKKGKKLAQLLIQHEIPFLWLSNNIKKQGIKIYNQILHSTEELKNAMNIQIIITVAARGAKAEILKELDRLSLKDLYFFC